MQVRCPSCGHSNQFEQPYAYHAGFGDQAFVYNDAGNCTLVWTIYDPLYEALLSKHQPQQPWALTSAAQCELEERLPASPRGDRWRFGNPARCTNCRSPISGAMTDDSAVNTSIYYLLYPDSIVLEGGPFARTLETYIEDELSA